MSSLSIFSSCHCLYARIRCCNSLHPQLFCFTRCSSFHCGCPNVQCSRKYMTEFESNLLAISRAFARSAGIHCKSEHTNSSSSCVTLTCSLSKFKQSWQTPPPTSPIHADVCSCQSVVAPACFSQVQCPPQPRSVDRLLRTLARTRLYCNNLQDAQKGLSHRVLALSGWVPPPTQNSMWCNISNGLSRKLKQPLFCISVLDSRGIEQCNTEWLQKV